MNLAFLLRRKTASWYKCWHNDKSWFELKVAIGFIGQLDVEQL